MGSADRKHREIAETLRDEEAHVDDVTRARMERRLIEAVSVGERARPELRALDRRAYLGGAVLVSLAAAAALFLALRPSPDASFARATVRELHSTIRDAPLAAGEVIRTGDAQRADVRFGDSVIAVMPGTVARFERVSREDFAVRLDHGNVHVEFHPAHRGEEHLRIVSDTATVEVVGTVFEVHVAESGATDVEVTEGVVRVVVADDGEVRQVPAGERTHVGAETVSEVVAPEPEVVPDPVVVAEPTPLPVAPAVRGAAPARPTVAELLEQAEGHLERGDLERARSVLGPVAAGNAPAEDRARASAWIGDSFQRERRYAEAAAAYRRAIDVGEEGLESLNAIYSLAMLYERRIGDFDAAKVSYARYLALAPNGPHAALSHGALCRLGVAEHCR